MLNKIEALVKRSGHLALATCADGRPHVSLMRFAVSPQTPGAGGEFWLATLRQTRKWSNLQANPRASLLLDDRGLAHGLAQGLPHDLGAEPGLALTVEAEHRPFADAAERQRARAGLLARHPDLEGFMALPEVEVMRLAALRYQLLTGLTEIFVWDPEKNLDARPLID